MRNKTNDMNKTLLYIVKDIKTMEEFFFKYTSIQTRLTREIIDFLNILIELSEKCYYTSEFIENLEVRSYYEGLVNILISFYSDRASDDTDSLDDDPTVEYIHTNVYPLLFMIKDILKDKLLEVNKNGI